MVCNVNAGTEEKGSLESTFAGRVIHPVKSGFYKIIRHKFYSCYNQTANLYGGVLNEEKVACPKCFGTGYILKFSQDREAAIAEAINNEVQMAGESAGYNDDRYYNSTYHRAQLESDPHRQKEVAKKYWNDKLFKAAQENRLEEVSRISKMITAFGWK